MTECRWRDFLDSRIPPESPALQRGGNEALPQRCTRLGCWGDQAPFTRKRRCEGQGRANQKASGLYCCKQLGRGGAAPGEIPEGGLFWWDPTPLGSPSGQLPRETPRRAGTASLLRTRAVCLCVWSARHPGCQRGPFLLPFSRSGQGQRSIRLWCDPSCLAKAAECTSRIPDPGTGPGRGRQLK